MKFKVTIEVEVESVNRFAVTNVLLNYLKNFDVTPIKPVDDITVPFMGNGSIRFERIE